MRLNFSGGRVDGCIYTNWVTYVTRLATTEYLAVRGSGLWMGGVDCLLWVVNASEVQGIYHGDPLCDFFSTIGGVVEELSSFSFTFFLMVGIVYYLSILQPGNNNNRDNILDEQYLNSL